MDLSDVAANITRQPLPSFVYDYFLGKCGVRGVAERMLHDFYQAVRRYSDKYACPLHPCWSIFALLLTNHPHPATGTLA